MLTPGQKLQTAAGIHCEVKKLLGIGGQGEVYRVNVAGKDMALKWYFPTFATLRQRQMLEQLIQRGAPTSRLLWPIELVSMQERDEFGYIMPLRDPQYRSLMDLMKRRIKKPEPTFRTLATAGFYLAESYFLLHADGLCYRDISFGNLFFDPATGDILICDNDNVTVDNTPDSGILGTSHFMAPEIVRGEALPSTKTDLFSLAVLLFYMFMFHHPLEGQREADIHVLDGAAMTRLHGHEPLFIFDPNDRSNAPLPGYQDNPLQLWPLYPQFLRDLFTRAFTEGLHDPENGRVREIEWRTAMIQLRDSICYCQQCNAQNFYDVHALKRSGGTLSPCWKCQQAIKLPPRIRIGDSVIMLNRDTRLYPHHIDSHQRWDFTQPCAEVTSHPSTPNLWGLKNLTQHKWVLVKPDNSMQDVDEGRSAPLTTGNKIYFGTMDGEIR
jgi:DNA-binding helix-hairpin-helix protein with protein kinase domain